LLHILSNRDIEVCMSNWQKRVAEKSSRKDIIYVTCNEFATRSQKESWKTFPTPKLSGNVKEKSAAAKVWEYYSQELTDNAARLGFFTIDIELVRVVSGRSTLEINEKMEAFKKESITKNNSDNWKSCTTRWRAGRSNGAA
jgi:hypothetical protein